VKVVDIERIVVDVPFTERQRRITQRTVYNWSILELCRVTADTGDVGWGETVIHYTHQRVTDASVERVLNRSPAEVMWDDSIGAGLQMALFDLLGKITGVSVHQLLGTKVRDHTPISWWCSHAAPDDWAAEATDAVAAGYTSFKNKPRPWWDVYAQVEAVSAVTPPHFKLDLDPNGSLKNAATAVPVLTRLAGYERVAMFETPIPQNDILGNRQIRRVVPRQVAMHFGSPPFITAVREEVCDGFVINGGASQVVRQGTLAEASGLPFWLQLVGNGLTTTWAAHLGAVLSHATWPTISCINLYTQQLLQTPIEVVGGYQPVPLGPGLGIEIDESAVERHRVPASTLQGLKPGQLFTHPRPRIINTLVFPDGTRVHMGAMGPHDYDAASGPGWSDGMRVEPSWEDDGTSAWEKLWDQVRAGGVVRDTERGA
jgi:L-alanine-DL-glutamate epimerase-like enolase superfamily enzyme